MRCKGGAKLEKFLHNKGMGGFFSFIVSRQADKTRIQARSVLDFRLLFFLFIQTHLSAFVHYGKYSESVLTQFDHRMTRLLA
jgi:hypothetical protein